jgi:hypothetical protein
MSPVNVNVKAGKVAISLQLPQFVDHFIHAFSFEVLYMEVIMGEFH